MPNLSINASLSLQATELATSVITLNRAVPGLLNNLLTTYYYEAFRQVPNSADVVPIPTPSGHAQVVLVRNAGAAGNIQVTLTPVGETEQIVATLTPGSALFLMELDTSLGWSTVVLEASAGTISAEVLIGA